MNIEETLMDHEKRIAKNEQDIENIKEALNFKKIVTWQILGSVISGSLVAILVQLLIH